MRLRDREYHFRYVGREELNEASGDHGDTVEGLCIRDDERSELLVLRDQSQLKLLDRTIHESLHACVWDIAEETVQETGADIAKLLWRLGWRIRA